MIEWVGLNFFRGMDKKIWTRIITLESGDLILLTKEYDNDDEAYQVRVSCNFEGMQGSIALGFEEEDKRDICFDEYAIEQAQTVWNNLNQFASDNT